MNIELEPARFGMTGKGIPEKVIDFDLYDLTGYCIDAPEFIPRGSAVGRSLQERTYITTTELRA